MNRAFLPFILGQRDEELFMDKTMVESMPKFRLRHYSYHEKNWTYGGKLYNGKSSTSSVLEGWKIALPR